MEPGLPLGEFTCPITFESIRPPKPVVKNEDGVTYVVQGDYEIAFQNRPLLHERHGVTNQGKATRGEQSEGCRP